MLAQELSQHGFRTRLCSDELEFTAYRGSTYFLRWLARRYPGHRFSLLLGADAWSSIPSWRDPVAGEMNGLELLRSVPLLVVPRPGTELECISPDKTQLIHPALPPEEQAAHRLLPTLGSYADAFALIAGEAVELELLSSRGIRNEIIDEKIGRSFCFPALEEQVRKSRTYLSR
jgi:nicotinic acid mononucleotide adenylyltransferase